VYQGATAIDVEATNSLVNWKMPKTHGGFYSADEFAKSFLKDKRHALAQRDHAINDAKRVKAKKVLDGV